MMLDKGICTIFRRKEQPSKPGAMPSVGYELLGQRWYGERAFETAPINPTEHREDAETAASIRILRMREIDSHCVVILQNDTDISSAAKRYQVKRAYQGRDEESGEEITDLTLTEVEYL